MQPPKSIATQKNSTNKNPKQNKTCHNSQSLFLLVNNSWKTYKTTFRSEPKRKEGGKEVRLNGIQPAKPKEGLQKRREAKP
jgi:hypothetical protein